MDQVQDAVSVISIALVECHPHGVWIKREPEDTGLFQKTPDDPAPTLRAHQPLQVQLFNLIGQSLAGRIIFPASLLASEIGWIVTVHIHILLPLARIMGIAISHAVT